MRFRNVRSTRRKVAFSPSRRFCCRSWRLLAFPAVTNGTGLQNETERHDMRVIVLCECSGVVREAFRALGHDAWSCDLQPADDGSPYHFQADALEVAKGPYDLAICHPPCTDIAVSGAAWFKQKIADGRQQEGIDFFMRFTRLDHIPRVAIENPVCIMSRLWRKPDQIIQPYEYGHRESKATCLWLKGLPKLTPTNVCEPEWQRNPDGTIYRDSGGSRYSPSHYNPEKWAKARRKNQTASGQNRLPPSADRAKIRSRTYEGIAKAMADQWSNLPPDDLSLIKQGLFF